MYAIVDIKGSQYKVEKGSKIYVDHLGEGEVEAPEVKTLLLKKDDDSVVVGTPYVDGASVDIKIGDVVKDDKVLIFKYKKRKDYHKTQGFRHKYHEVTIEDIKA